MKYRITLSSGGQTVVCYEVKTYRWICRRVVFKASGKTVELAGTIAIQEI